MAKKSSAAKTIIKISIVTICVNLTLAVLKLVFGLVFDNLSVVSDAAHSASDFFTSFLIIAAVLMSSPKRDEKHNYGHEKVEPLITLFLALVLAGVGGVLMWQGIDGIISPIEAEINFFLIGVTILSLIAKETLFWFEMHYAKKLNSQMLKADAWHSRSDSLASLAVLIGLVSTTFMANNILESVAVLIVSLMIFKVAFDVIKPAINQLIDKAADQEVHDKIEAIASAVEGVRKVDSIHTRMFGNKIFVDMEIAVDGNLTVTESHNIAEAVHDILEDTEELHIKHCMVHVNPCTESEKQEDSLGDKFSVKN